MEKNEILKIYGTDYKNKTKELLEAADLSGRIPGKQAAIGIKPNLVSPTEASWGATTHPEVVAGIIEYLKEHGYENLMILEGSWVGDKTEDAVEICGYRKLSETYGVPFVDTQKDQSSEYDCGEMKLSICHSAMALDFLINVPVLKGHCQTKMTCALKNMKGLIPNKEKRRFHALGLHEPIAHLNLRIRQDFVVIDHICGDLDFEDGGNPVVRNCIMAAADPVLADAYCASLLHYEVSEIPYLVRAGELGAGCADVSQARIKVIGGEEGETALPKSRKVVELQDAVEEVESCSACYGYLIPALAMLKEEGLFEKLNQKICIGQGFRGKKGCLGVGNCTREFDYTVKGCPPTEQEIYEFLKGYLQGFQEEEQNKPINHES
jgi:uncharacterized protein (DUF362 family)